MSSNGVHRRGMEHSPRPREICGGMMVPGPQMERQWCFHEYCKSISKFSEPHATSELGRSLSLPKTRACPIAIRQRQTRFRRGSLGHVATMQTEPLRTLHHQHQHPQQRGRLKPTEAARQTQFFPTSLFLRISLIEGILLPQVPNFPALGMVERHQRHWA